MSVTTIQSLSTELLKRYLSENKSKLNNSENRKQIPKESVMGIGPSYRRVTSDAKFNIFIFFLRFFFSEF